MAAMWALLGVIVGTSVAMIAGALLDYMQFRNLLPDSVEPFLAMPPWIAALGGLVGSIASAALASRGRQPVKKDPVKTIPGATKARSGETAVPGMPTFDFSQSPQPGSARQDAAAGPAVKEEHKI